MFRHYDVFNTALLRFIMWSALLICVTASPTYGQTYWSDNWIVAPPVDSDATDDPDELPTYPLGADVQGCGITEDYYDSYGHDYSVETRVTSPSGSLSVTFSSGWSHVYARADVFLPIRSDEIGYYATSSLHRGYCPIGMSSLGPVSTVAGGVGAGLSAYVFAGIVPPGVCLWQPYPCTAGCSQEHATNQFAGQCFTQGRIYRQCLDGYYYGVCLVRRVVCAGRLQPGFCRNG